MSTEVGSDDLGGFFQRPIQIRSWEWSGTVAFFQEFDPWKDFLENPRVMNRINNYRNLKGNLCLKFLINGNGFYYGRVIAHYVPLHTMDAFTLIRGLGQTQDLVEASQRPHVYINPTVSQGGTMCLPFLWDADSLSIPDKEWLSMGKIYLNEMNKLRHANGGTEPLTISVFAWMENVELSVPTSRNINGLAPQSGVESKSSGKKKKPKGTSVTSNAASTQDEYGSGPISKPASVVAAIAGKLSAIPYIGPYAKATAIGASGIANIAKLFGYSRPAEISNVTRYTPRYVPELAPTNVPDTVCKLTTDVKQELTIDNRVVGAGPHDEMSILAIATRESFLDTFFVNTAQPVDSIIYSMAITPTIFNKYNSGGGAPDEYHTPACSFAALPFKYWRGTMKVRIQVVASVFHKGRLRLQWDPSGYTSLEANTQFTHIVDIADDKDFTIEIGWGRELGWLQTQTDKSVASEYYKFYPEVAQPSSNYANGVMTLSILNSISTPSSQGESIAFNVFVSMGDDFEVAVPQYLLHEVIRPADAETEGDGGDCLCPQSGLEGESTMNVESTPPVSDTTIAVFGNTSSDNYNSLVYHGENITSFRSLLKRYNCLGCRNLTVGAEGQTDSFGSVIINHTIYPPYRGVQSGNSFPPGSQELNRNNLTLYGYLAPAFVTARGGFRYKLLYMDTDDSHRWMTAELRTVSGNLGLPAQQDRTPPYYEGMARGETGTAITPAWVNPVLEVEIPYQTNYRFERVRRASPSPDIMRHRQWQVGVHGKPGPVRIDYWCAAAEDFSLGFFLNAPVLYDTA